MKYVQVHSMWNLILYWIYEVKKQQKLVFFLISTIILFIIISFLKFKIDIMSHCWNQDGSEFSTVCIVVIALGIFTALVSICCIAKIFKLATRIRQDQKNIASDQIELEEFELWQIKSYLYPLDGNVQRYTT